MQFPIKFCFDIWNIQRWFMNLYKITKIVENYWKSLERWEDMSPQISKHPVYL